MTSKHTPGPWFRRGADTYRWQVEAGENPKKATVIARVTTPRGGAVVRAANALLIAAAPEMLEALRWTQQTVHQAHHDGDMSKCEKNTCLHIRGVISKAEGRSEG